MAKINGIWYYFNDGGVMATGPKYMFDENTYDTKLYYFDNSGALQYKKVGLIILGNIIMTGTI